ncbi:hypothetical protein BpHYR1_023305 [Brachionus plicatilis]|uniref:Uncharacterized protein n=1 Tax=Brachionus plicatilis TaxID=10195 RepID=A0A3M7P4T4_BRAPC|nr:hypothetical protein BpHYR1_023305 [Brachionus plicatilis]
MFIGKTFKSSTIHNYQLPFKCIYFHAFGNNLLVRYMELYQLQEPLENLNNSLPSNSWVAKILRFCFSYTMSIAYVSQWRTYWDIYNYYSTKIHFKYTVLLSMMALICFRVFLDRKLTPLIKCVPFHLESSKDLSNFFTQPKIFSLKSRLAQNLVNFVYMEFVEMLINVFIWKGIWDVFELGTCFELICFIGLVALWRSFFALFDFYVLKSDFKLEISCTTHALLFTSMYLIGLISALNGPAGFEAESDRQKEPNLKFNISYFS